MRPRLIAILVVFAWLSVTPRLWAQSSLVPSLGFNRGGEAFCPSAQTCDERIRASELFGRTPEGSRLFVLLDGGLIARVTPRISARFTPQGTSLKLWRGTFGVVIRF